MSRSEGIVIFVTSSFYILLIIGICLLFAGKLQSLYDRWRMMRRLEARKREYRIEGYC
jgi:hypothetical protein